MSKLNVSVERNGRLIIASGPAACGKTTTIDKIRAEKEAAGLKTKTFILGHMSADTDAKIEIEIKKSLETCDVVFVEHLTA